MSTKSWPQIPTQTLADQVYRVVRRRILERELEPGEFVREQELSRAMGVSRTPVREALGRLASDGFLNRIPHRGFQIPDESLADLLDLYPILSALELLAGRLALPELTEDDIAELRELNEQLRRARDRNDVAGAIEINNRFHHNICERSGNRRLVDMLRDLRSQVMRLEIWYYSSKEHTERSIREHDNIIQLLEEGRHEEALEIFETNMLWTLRALREEQGLAAIQGDGGS